MIMEIPTCQNLINKVVYTQTCANGSFAQKASYKQKCKHLHLLCHSKDLGGLFRGHEGLQWGGSTKNLSHNPKAKDFTSKAGSKACFSYGSKFVSHILVETRTGKLFQE